MALTKSHQSDQAWRTPVWPETLPKVESLHAVYGPEADELTIRFPETPNRDIVVVFLDVPEVDYAALMVHQHTGEVVGVQVDYLVDYAVSLHPLWEAAIEKNPPPVVAGRIVSDIKDLFDRYGIETGDDE